MKTKNIEEGGLFKPEAEALHKLMEHILERTQKTQEKLKIFKKQFDLNGFKMEEGGYDEPMVWRHKESEYLFVQNEDGSGYYIPIAWPDDVDPLEKFDKRTRELLILLNLYDTLLDYLMGEVCPNEGRIFAVVVELYSGEKEMPLEVNWRDMDETGWSIYIETNYNHKFLVEFPFFPTKKKEFGITKIDDIYIKVNMDMVG